MRWELVGLLVDVETIAVGAAIRDLAQLRDRFGKGRWRKMKGRGLVAFGDGSMGWAEIHWYEAHGIGRRRLKLKRVLQ